jgi:hypothetical protein
MKPPLAGRDHIERHHGGEHLPARQPIAQRGRVGDAVLQTHDDGVGWRVPGDSIRDLGRIRAFDGHQHHAGVGQDLRVVGQPDLLRCQMPGRTFQARQGQPETLDLGDQTRTRQQRHAAAAAGQQAADKASDATGACHDDRPIKRLCHSCSGKASIKCRLRQFW